VVDADSVSRNRGVVTRSPFSEVYPFAGDPVPFEIRYGMLKETSNRLEKGRNVWKLPEYCSPPIGPSRHWPA